ncbi:M20/M25/M40 family metallo-hydrolase [Synergistes jonesii]|uniref:M20/M25/M40 family metallo-hydrolase n=1 Tax=Synergistes jonesii TaxID=2754 RepID=UPI00248EF2C9|nr:M20/M25/M40 family metallo-hydrolase [Synergistes jonesii]
MDRNYLLPLIKELVAAPSVTESAEESLPGEIIYSRLSGLSYFKERPHHLRLVDTPLEGSPHKLKSLIARVDAAEKTPRTVLMIGHYDVVDVKCYGEIAKHAFDTEKLAEIFRADADTLYGRGTMDMKCGDAIETALIEEFAKDRSIFDVNLVMALVGDEENSSAGMRGVLPALFEMEREGLDFLAALNTEPGEAGQSGVTGPMVFLGTLGKLMPGFYVRGRDAHVGNCYDGFSALLAASRAVAAAEGDPCLADPARGVCQPSWICLDMGALRDVYSVTVPDKAYAYFNCFTTNNGPAQIMEQMKGVALRALEESSGQLEASYKSLLSKGYNGSAFSAPEPAVYTLGELTKLAAARAGEAFDAELRDFTASLPPGDMRARGIKVVDFIADRSGAEPPYVAVFFLPPWLPVRTDFTGLPRDAAVVGAAREIEAECAEKYGLKMTEVEFFSGLCDLSYVGGRVSDGDIAALAENMPGWGEIYSLPLKEMQALGLPVINLGPSGAAPHRKEERLYLSYSLDVLPELLKKLIAKISQKAR